MWTVHHVVTTGSTNADVAAAAQAGAAEGYAVVADHQSAGRGRLDRSWDTPAGQAVAVSFLLRPNDVPLTRWPWLPLLVGVAAVEAVGQAAGVTATLKWPNDVLVEDAKLAGILVERIETDAGPAAVAGVGINVSQDPDPLPAGAVSLARVTGGQVARDVVVGPLLERLAARYTAWRDDAGDPGPWLATTYARHCDTLGRRVRAELPGGGAVTGRASAVDDDGRLVVDTDAGPTAIGAGDVVHLRRG